MPLDILNINLSAVLPEMLVAGLALIVLVADLFTGRRHKYLLGYLSIIGLLSIMPAVYENIFEGAFFGGTVLSDRFSAFFDTIFIISSVLAVFMSIDYLKKTGIFKGEYYHIILFATLGMMVMASANDLINLYVGLELMALSFYILVAMRSDNLRATEGALKYFILGALSSSILLLGMSFTYGFAGTTNIAEIANISRSVAMDNPFMLLGVSLTAVGFSFKIALFPFHMWAPDAYEGAPPPVTALLSVGSKTAAFAVFLRVFGVSFLTLRPQWSSLLWALAAGTMIFGSVVAIAQTKIIRMLAYSSIAHAGIIIIGLLNGNRDGMAGSMFYLLVYAFMNMGAFAVVTLFIKDGGKGELISDYRGLSQRHPLLSVIMALFLLSLAGIPPTAGFAAKFFVLASAVNAGYYWLAAIAVVSTAISLYFYVKVIFYMFMREGEEGAPMVETGFDYSVVLVVTVIGTVLLGVYPAPFMDAAMSAVSSFIMQGF